MATARRQKKNDRPAADKEFAQTIIDLSRVTRVMAGGKRMRFRACVVVGDKKGKIGYGIAKGADVTLAVNKAATKAKKAMVTIPITNGTIPHALEIKFKAARMLMKPAPQGTGVMAGGAVRQALELSGIDNIVAKIFGSKNKLNNIHALFAALVELGKPRIHVRTVSKKREAVSVAA